MSHCFGFIRLLRKRCPRAAAHLAEPADYLELDGNILIADDPYQGVTSENGFLSFADTKKKCGLQVILRNEL
jgi:hypothetical protein